MSSCNVDGHVIRVSGRRPVGLEGRGVDPPDAVGLGGGKQLIAREEDVDGTVVGRILKLE